MKRQINNCLSSRVVKFKERWLLGAGDQEEWNMVVYPEQSFSLEIRKDTRAESHTMRLYLIPYV